MVPLDSLSPSCRNTRQPPCAPCRTRKLACDRSQPVCNRCQRARTKLNCIYPSTPQLETHTPDLAADLGIETGPSLGQEAVANTTSNSTPSGYFGYTSHNKVFEETEFDLFLASGGTSLLDPSKRLAQSHEESHDRVIFRELPSPCQESALFVLRCLPSLQAYCHEPFHEQKGWSQIAVNRIIKSLQAAFETLPDEGDKCFSDLAEILCRNTRRAIEDEQDDASQWISQFHDQNLRWESIGLLWASIARVSDDVGSLYRHHLNAFSESVSPQTAQACLGYCIELSRTFTDGNDLLLELCRRKAIFDSIVDGDARISSYVSHSLSVTMLTYLGYHSLENGPSYEPTLCSENRRRVVAQVFTSDKFAVSFTGRPPLLTNSFCSTPMPLDISDKDLASDKTALSHAVQSLDDQGWNTSGEIHPSTVIRARYMIASIRDELIAVALSHSKEVERDQIQALKDRQLVFPSKIPDALRYSLNDLIDPDLDSRTLYFRITLQLDHLKNLFFAERLLLRCSNFDDTELLSTSFDLVRLTIELWKRRDSLNDPVILRDFEWLLLEYGAPAGGILCQGLLQPSPAYSNTQNIEMTRSSIVQQLSLLIGFLDWVSPSAPAGQSCASFKHLIQRVLDHHLNGNDWQQDARSPSILESRPLQLPAFRFDLLNTFDWFIPSPSGSNNR
ncbi:hypothetical protein HER10_EVM0012038 [Colletotrichum scovillei]|uniref:C6 transcription factor n=1 Tax=Colletotrichum scovillei TaxID=1209932 RepID=A0A9P7UDW3_9PEZI|nr:uncharacterized protein HER10_EVM0012038 [Colletotrichum scovillei]KAF4783628.1 hypothetical protein HER10_EVM0012038 [Colletotrichum scovillei]KAG7053064.1 C6 transcription factor [Colletotrichum scovillei]KAG7071355.1 C6 transcription factor [Colletotrichum scovillei]KAG7079635.1 C6 transcription factor [Colletotrichum scovillei]